VRPTLAAASEGQGAAQRRESGAATVLLFSTLATRKALEDELLDAFTAATGFGVDVVFDPTTELARRLESGERPDVIIAVTSALHTLAETGLVESGSIVPLTRTKVGVAVAKGAARPDLSSAESFVQAMVQARSVAYSQTGASGIYLRAVLGELGVLDQVNERATVLERGFTATALIDGRADIAVQQLSELAFVADVDIVGPLPDTLECVTEFSGALPAGAEPTAASVALLRFLTAEGARAPYERSGLEAV